MAVSSLLPDNSFNFSRFAAESERLVALRAQKILDTPPEAAFDRIAALAARLFGVPMALISFVDDERQWFKAAHGIEICQTSREISFCSYAIEQNEVMVVPDATLDPRFARNPLVLGAPNVRFYAGAPIVGRDGLALGSLCILDSAPRDFGENERRTLSDLAAIVVDELELRLGAQKLKTESNARQNAQNALLESQTRFKIAFEMSAIGMALLSTEGKWLQVNSSLCEMLGYSPAQLLERTFQDITFADDLNGDLELVRQILAGEIASYDLEKRYVRGDGALMWAFLSVALVRDESGAPLYFVSQVQDISARKVVEEQLRQSEARKAAIVETALDCIITIDTQSRVLEWNGAAEKTFGYSREEALNAPLHQLIVPEKLREAHRAGLNHWQLTGEGPILGRRIELPAVRADGTQITVELAVVAIPGSDPPLFTGHLRDVSERRAVEERLRLLESVAVNANDAILITEAEPIDLPGPRIRYANKAFLDMSGYALEEIVGQTPRILQGPGTLPESKAKIRAALQKWQPIVIEMLNYKKDGTPFWVELSIAPVANEKGWYTHWVSIQRETSQSREVLQALRESEGRYGRIAANVPGMVYQFSLQPDGTFGFPFVSEGCRELYELEPSQLMADAALMMDLTHPDDVENFRTSIEHSAQTLTPWEWEGRVVLPGEKTKWIRGSSRPKREENGEIIWDGILFDVTQRKIEQELLQLAKTDAEIAREEAERANLAKSEFLSRMSHELRTPLNAILGFGQLLEMAPLDEDDAQSTTQIMNAGRHLLDLINEVLDIARIESGQLSLSPEPVEVRQICLETLDLVRPLAAARGIVVRDEALKNCDFYLRADRQRLKQILLNLLSNAVKYNRENGEVRVECEATAEGRLRICVSDDGAGIAPEMAGRIFTPFDRLGAENSAIEGTGVGLALSRRLAQAMDGTLDFERNTAEKSASGSKFWVELPRATDPFHRLEAHRASLVGGEIVNTDLLVLYIEDNPSNLQLVQRILARRPQIRLLTAISGEIGIELARQHCPDLILLDLHLPDTSGAQVLQILRADAQTRAIPIVVVSADATETQIARLLEAGAQNYLTKPFDVRELLRLLDTQMELNSSHQPSQNEVIS